MGRFDSIWGFPRLRLHRDGKLLCIGFSVQVYIGSLVFEYYQLGKQDLRFRFLGARVDYGVKGPFAGKARA